jgi:hypothetical protein
MRLEGPPLLEYPSPGAPRKGGLCPLLPTEAPAREDGVSACHR